MRSVALLAWTREALPAQVPLEMQVSAARGAAMQPRLQAKRLQQPGHVLGWARSERAGSAQARSMA